MSQQRPALQTAASQDDSSGHTSDTTRSAVQTHDSSQRLEDLLTGLGKSFQETVEKMKCNEMKTDKLSSEVHEIKEEVSTIKSTLDQVLKLLQRSTISSCSETNSEVLACSSENCEVLVERDQASDSCAVLNFDTSAVVPESDTDTYEQKPIDVDTFSLNAIFENANDVDNSTIIKPPPEELYEDIAADHDMNLASVFNSGSEEEDIASKEKSTVVFRHRDTKFAGPVELKRSDLSSFKVSRKVSRSSKAQKKAQKNTGGKFKCSSDSKILKDDDSTIVKEHILSSNAPSSEGGNLPELSTVSTSEPVNLSTITMQGCVDEDNITTTPDTSSLTACTHDSSDVNKATASVNPTFHDKSHDPSPRLGAIPISLLPQSEVNRYRNAALVQKLIPDALLTLFLWICHDKVQNDDYLSYVLGKLKISTNDLKGKHHVSASELKTLKGNDASSFDITLQVKLIKLLTDIGDCPHTTIEEHVASTPECLLWRVKDFRNEVSHKIKTSSTSSDVFDAAKNVLIELFFIIGCSKLNVERKIVDEQIEKIEAAFEGIANTDHERKCIERQYVFRTEAFSESQSYWKEYCTTEAVPFDGTVVDSESIFHPMELYVEERSSGNVSASAKESYRQILKRTRLDGRRATILIGVGGSGKSVVVKNIALQFLEIIDAEVDFLNEIHLLLFLECRDRSTDSLEKVLQNNFPISCRKISIENAVDCFCSIGSLIIVDGYDEVNESSSEVINQILRRMKSMSSCQILFTTRDHKAEQLKGLLSSYGIKFSKFELVPLSEEAEQLKFLQRYEMHLSDGDHSFERMTESFKKLLPDVKQFFVHPINLVLFYSLYKHSFETIASLETVNDVIEQMLILYEKFLAQKLLDRPFANQECFIREALEEIYQFAFDCISENKIMMSEEDMRPVERCLVKKFRDWDLLKTLDINVVKSVVFLTKKLPSPKPHLVYQFYHKGVQEIMAARIFFKSMKSEPDLALQTLLNRSSIKNRETWHEFNRYQNVLLFVMSYLAQPSNIDILKHREPELRSIFSSIGVDMKYNSEIVLTKPHCEALVSLSITMMKNLSLWITRSHREYQAAFVMLKSFQPESLHIDYRQDGDLPSSLKDLLRLIKHKFEGTLQLFFSSSFNNFTPLDSVVQEMVPFSGACSVQATKSIISGLSSANGLPKTVHLLNRRRCRLAEAHNDPGASRSQVWT
ncbi:uncharacterized protein LOC108677393 [Hyalella azteca]|uniref:Uncharacterized protein LOC108677393 n=1 Tax=Hyalella azteca TaxID=294128 RepID=A0A979FUI9_HYAAZ|nr:uncharacterized protein LOC108677393 [Hyalella azteca]